MLRALIFVDADRHLLVIRCFIDDQLAFGVWTLWMASSDIFGRHAARDLTVLIELRGTLASRFPSTESR